jgi:Asp-tRNA(Asn)/Glu-tRNA(Gln) amidotransferase A subunit family amidase
VLRALIDTETADFEINDIFEQAINDLKTAGATIVDPFSVEHFDELRKAVRFCSRFRYDINNYLASLGKNAPVKSLDEVVENKSYGDYSKDAMQWAMSVNIKPQKQTPPCIDVQGDPRRKRFLDAVLTAMDKYQIDAIIYPSWSNPPRELGDNESPHGNNSPVIAPHTGQPAITVPMGFSSDGLPAGLQILGRYFDEGKLFQYAYAYEQATKHRRTPELFKAIQ